jgi:hypothetical protein
MLYIVLLLAEMKLSKYVRDFRLPLRIDENCAILGYYAASSGNLLPTFRDDLLVPDSGVTSPEDWTNNSSRNVGNKLPLLSTL